MENAMMKIKRFEPFFVIAMIAFCFLVFLTDLSFRWKMLCMTLYVIMILFTVMALWLENRSAQNTLLWVYILVLLPVLGYIFYVYSGQLQFKGELFKSKRSSDRHLFETLSSKQKALDVSKLNDHQRCFFSYLERVTLTDQNQNTMTKVLKNGEDTFWEIKRRLKEANDFIHLEYYIFRYDRLGRELIEILTDKVKEGVEVRLIYDAFGSFSLSEADIKRIEEDGIKVQPFLPIKTA
jgi:cardiolipin synthase